MTEPDTVVPLIALISTTEQQTKGHTFHQNYSDLLWTLWRLGAHTMIAQTKEHQHLEHALKYLQPPPAPYQYEDRLLEQLQSSQRKRLKENIWSQLPWSKKFKVLSIPEKPFVFDEINLCFHDELIGQSNAFLIHYGLSHFNVSGYHHPISAISVPVGDEVSALLIARIPYKNKDSSVVNSELETCVIHLDAQGQKLKGPWWPRLGLSS